jgi:hypothetical protein
VKHIRLIPLLLAMLALLACTCSTLSLPSLPAAPSSTPRPLSSTPPPGITAPAIDQNKAPFDIAWDDYSLFEKNLVASYQDELTALPGASIYHIAYSLSDPPTVLNGVEEVRYTNTESVSLSEVDFAVFAEILGGSIAIQRLAVDGQPISANHQDGIMRVPLATPLQPGQSLTFHIEFEVAVPTQGGGYYYGIFGYNSGILSLAQAYPTILVYNQEGWNNQTPDLDGDPLFSDTSFYLVSVDAPADLTLAASGIEVEHSQTASRQGVLYANGPARDFYLAASADFVQQSEKVGETTFNSYGPAGLEQYTRSALKIAEAAIGDFSQRYAPYPYTEFDIVPIITSAGGVEFPGMMAIAENVYNAGDFLEIVVAHEAGHQWFYNLVGNATQEQPWLDEAMAEFVTWQYYLDRYGPAEAETYRQEMKASWDMLGDQDIPIGEPVSDYTSSGYVAIVYGRGPLFVLALRDQMGQATFDRFLHDYVQDYAWKIATTGDYQALAEQECNCDLTALFDEWVYP